MTTLCVVATCRAYGRHKPTCIGCSCGRQPRCTALEHCDGCLPRLAADGAYICVPHRNRLAEDAMTAALFYAELELRLALSDRPGELVTGTPTRSPAVNEAAVEARKLIRHTLVGWSKLISEERGITLPDDTVTAMGGYVAKHADWLAATEYADEVCDELHELAWGQPRRVARPSGTKVKELGPCPVEECAGAVMVVVRRAHALLPTIEVTCDAEQPHRWTSDQWRALARAMERRAA